MTPQNHKPTPEILRAEFPPTHVTSEIVCSVHSRNGAGNPATPNASEGFNPLSYQPLGGPKIPARFNRFGRLHEELNRRQRNRRIAAVAKWVCALIAAALIGTFIGSIATKAIAQAAYDAAQYERFSQ